MSQLENTLIQVAEQALKEMESFNDGRLDSRKDFYSRFYVVQAYAYIAHLENSALSEEAIKKLIDIEGKSNKLLQNESPRS